MESLALLMGHLIGDYVFQNDWMAANKTNPLARTGGPIEEMLVATGKELDGHLACTVHCCLYTVAVWLTCWWFLPGWAYIVIFFTHWPVDRFRLAVYWMRLIGQKQFATNLSPWSVILVDNIFHLLVLFLLGLTVTPNWKALP